MVNINKWEYKLAEVIFYTDKPKRKYREGGT